MLLIVAILILEYKYNTFKLILKQILNYFRWQWIWKNIYLNAFAAPTV